MNYATLTLGIAFLVIGIAFRTKASGQDERAMKNKRFASNFMFAASAAFFFSAALSALRMGAD